MCSGCHSLGKCTFLYNYRYKYGYETAITWLHIFELVLNIHIDAKTTVDINPKILQDVLMKMSTLRLREMPCGKRLLIACNLYLQCTYCLLGGCQL